MSKVWLFYRKDGFYPIDVPDDYADVEAHVDLNPGTLRVEEVSTNGSRVLWEAKPPEPGPEAVQKTQ